jgi:hypothetical protein
MNADHRYIKGTPKGPQESGLLEFTKSACLTIDAFTDDAEVAADSYRAHWTDLGQGIVQIEKIERNDARHGKPANWVKDVLSDLEVQALEAMIEQQLKYDRTTEQGTTWAEAVGPIEAHGVRA